MGTGLEAALFVVGGAFVGFTVQQQMKAGKAAEKAAEAEKKRQELEAARQRRRVAREGQAARARVVASGEAQGAAGSSAVVGGQVSAQTTQNQNLQFIGLTEELSDERFNALQKMRKHEQLANFAKQGASLAFQGAGMI